MVHAHISHHRTPFAAYQHLAPVVGETAVETVRVTDRYHRYLPWLREGGMSPVTYRLARLHGLHAENGGLQRAYIAQFLARKREPVQSDAETAHIKLILRKPFNTCRVAYMLDYRIVESCLQGLRARIKIVYLLQRELVKLRFVAASEVREHALYLHCRLRLQAFNQARQLFTIESQPVHARIYLDMHGAMLQSLCGCGFDNVLQRLE